MQTKAGIERAVVDVLRKLGFLKGAPNGPAATADRQAEAGGLMAARGY